MIIEAAPVVAASWPADRNIGIVATADAVVVLPRSRAQEVKGIVESLQKAAKEKAMGDKAGE